jgi:hypothetical protein
MPTTDERVCVLNDRQSDDEEEAIKNCAAKPPEGDLPRTLTALCNAGVFGGHHQIVSWYAATR